MSGRTARNLSLHPRGKRLDTHRYWSSACPQYWEQLLPGLDKRAESIDPLPWVMTVKYGLASQRLQAHLPRNVACA